MSFWPSCRIHGDAAAALKPHLSHILTVVSRRGFKRGGLMASPPTWPINIIILHTTSEFFAGSNPSRPDDKEAFSHCSKLFDLETGTNTGFLAAPICSLFSSTLTRLDFSFDDEVQYLTKEQEEALQLLTALQELRFSQGPKLQRLPAGLHELINLKKLQISFCGAIRSLTSLPSSLQELQIFDCGAIKLLPKDGLPGSMVELIVRDSNSEELKRQCRKLIGTIPIIRT
ncbi:hypothetical protein BRADI_5g22866v3 [Brachypodium distachyon]|uniref:NB-ARC domain-containing protein n=1 Tax=Brachypodium distachyon TaxID=15368 RepID=A0A0Q3IF38_BRADI|nr:hypothetical protein BRADI_5g22866v3 [Brachypodium distachyon]